MKKILSLQTLSEKSQTKLHAASNISILCKKQSTISLIWCVWKPRDSN
ncbi:TPA: class III lanthipeptide [Streptococcus suis]|nr:class III lanthipeptide [Streptococcus suis]